MQRADRPLSLAAGGSVEDTETVGCPVPGDGVRIAEDVLVHGSNVTQGYLRDAEAPAEPLKR